MKTMFCIVLVFFVITACVPTKPQVTAETTATDIPAAGIPNPASMNCIEKGNKLEIVTAEDGSQSGVCIFPDGSICEEWAYFRGECGPSVQNTPILEVTADQTTNTNEPVEDSMEWVGTIKSTEPGAQFNDYFETLDSGQVKSYGIDSLDDTIKSQIEALRDSNKIVHIFGTLSTDVPDYFGTQIQVDRIEVEE